MSLSAKLIGKPFIASIDYKGNRKNKSECAYIVKDYLVPRGYGAYILDSTFPEEYVRNLVSYFPDASILYGLESCSIFHDYDIIDVSETGVIRFLYSDCAGDTVLFITNKCNSNCIMCPDSDFNRKRDIGNRKQYLEKLIDLLPSDISHITITGGEPTLLKWDLLDILSKCKDKFEDTAFLMLSNGRSFSDKEYCSAFLNVVPKVFRIGVPIYADNPVIHDAITRAPGSFTQTVLALSRLQNVIETEIRVVVMRNTYRELPNIARFLTKKLPLIYTVSLMGMEILGNAAINRGELWIDFAETVPYIEEAVQILLSSGIEAKIYNYPLCSLPRTLWSIAAKSITDYKVTYQPECELCKIKSLCGGFFSSTMHAEKIPVYPIKEKNVDKK